MKFTLIVGLTFLTFQSFSQTVTQRISSVESFRKFKEATNPEIIHLPSIDNSRLLENDDKMKREGPLRFGQSVPVSINMIKESNKKETSEGFIYSLKITSKNALSLNFVFDKFNLSEGSEFIIYNSEHNMLIGPITSKQNNVKNIFRTDIIQGESAIMELFIPFNEEANNYVEISKIVHGYRDIFGILGYGDSESCNVNVNCP